MKLLTVITITRNNHQELIQTCQSLALNTEIEHIIVNGGDDSMTRDFLKNQFQGFSISEPDHGIADAINKGIRSVQTPYFMILNSGDTLLNSQYFSQALHLLESKPDLDFVHGDIVFSDNLIHDFTLKPQFCNLGRGMPFNILTAIFRTPRFLEVGFFDLNYQISMDFDWVVRAQKYQLQQHYLEIGPVVQMDGRGVSTRREWFGILECYRSLKSHSAFDISTRYSFFKRFFFYHARNTLVKMGLQDIYKALKILKYKVL